MGETVMNGLMDDPRQRGMKVEGQVQSFSSFDSDIETARVMKNCHNCSVILLQLKNGTTLMSQFNVQECWPALGIIKNFVTEWKFLSQQLINPQSACTAKVTVVVLYVYGFLSTTILVQQTMTWIVSDISNLNVTSAWKLNGNFPKTAALEIKKLDKTLPVQRILEACSGRTSSRSAFLNIAVSAASPHSSKNF